MNKNRYNKPSGLRQEGRERKPQEVQGMSFAEIGEGFAQQYYQVFSDDVSQLGGVYRENSLMTWSGAQLQGVENIINHLTNLPLGRLAFNVEDIDCHPSLSDGVLLVVQGAIQLEGEEHTLKFNDVMHLAQDEGQWYISNQIFRIIGGADA